MKFTIKNAPTYKGGLDLAWKVKNKHLQNETMVISEIIWNSIYSAEAFGWSQLQIVDQLLKTISMYIEEINPDSKAKNDLKAYKLPQELGDKIWMLQKEYFEKNKNGKSNG
tara:strand:- start:172 stop:504 length:333 start_codon:yes stop_codon:yes gene_type:complete